MPPDNNGSEQGIRSSVAFPSLPTSTIMIGLVLGMKSNKSITMFIIVSILVSCIAATLSILLLDRLSGDAGRKIDLKITALGTKGDAARSSEVWLSSLALPPEINVDALLASSQPAGGWVRRDTALLSFEKQPATLEWFGSLADGATLTFAKHPWSGRVLVEVNGSATEYDLYADEVHPVAQVIPITDANTPVSKVPWLRSHLSILAALMVTFFLSILFLRLASEPRVSRKRRAVYTIFLVLGSLLWLALTLYQSKTDVAPDEIFKIVRYVIVVLAIEAVTINIISQFVRPLSALLLAANSISLNLTFTSLPYTQPALVNVLILALTVGLYMVILDILTRFKIAQKVVFPLISVACAGTFYHLSAASDAEANPQKEVFDGIQMVDFLDKPNIYFLSFDAMIPETLAQKFLGFRPHHLDGLAGLPNTQLFKNMFSDGNATKVSLNQILRLRPNNVLVDDALVTGLKPSPLREIMRYNGYETYFSYHISYFGPRKGPYLDHYWVDLPYSTCSLLKGNAWFLGFFGYCLSRKTNFLPDVDNNSELTTEKINREAMARLVGLSKTGRRPFFLMQHFPFPSHADGNLETNEERQGFFNNYRRYSELAFSTMTDLVKSIRENDPTGIIFIYSDHGTWTSRALNFSDNPSVVVQDRYGIFAGMINADQCSPYFRPPKGETFQTNSRIVTALLQCLAGGKSPLTTPFDYNLIPQFDGTVKFQDYVYE